MKIVICVKAVKSTLVFSHSDYEEPFFFNPYDLKALEECIRLKEISDVELTCILMGPKESICVLNKCLAMGIDRALFLNDESFAGSDTIATSYIISKAIEYIGQYDMIVCGEKSIDGETGQVVFGIAERLGIPVISNVSQICSVCDASWTVETVDYEQINKITGTFPIVLTVSEFSTAYPKLSLIALKRAKLKTIEIKDAAGINADPQKCGLRGSKTRVVAMDKRFGERKQLSIQGTSAECASFILKQMIIERNR